VRPRAVEHRVDDADGVLERLPSTQSSHRVGWPATRSEFRARTEG
jgi:hypothetical protein